MNCHEFPRSTKADALLLLSDPAWQQVSRRVLAQRLGVSHTTVLRWISGTVPDNSTVRVQRQSSRGKEHAYTLRLPRRPPPPPTLTPREVLSALVAQGAIAPSAAPLWLTRLEGLPPAQRKMAVEMLAALGQG
jgi:hypothetical protein